MSDTLDSLRAERDEAHARSVAAGNERDALRQQLRDQAAEAEELVEQGRQAERDEIVRWMFDRRIFVTVPHTTAELLAIIQRETEWREKDRQKRIGAVEANRTVSEARAERDAIQSRLDAIANREPTADEIDRLEDEWEHAVGPVARWWWRHIRDALLATAQESGEEGRAWPPTHKPTAVADQRAPTPAPIYDSFRKLDYILIDQVPKPTAPVPTSEDLPAAPSCPRCMDRRVVQTGDGSAESCPACTPAPALNRCATCRVVVGPSPGWHECRGATWAASILHRAESELGTIANNTGRVLYPDEADALIAELARLRAEKEKP